MKRRFKLIVSAIIGVLLGGSAAFAQNTSVTATVTDSQGAVWSNASYTINFLGSQPGTPITTGGQQFQQSFSGSLNGSGQLAVTLTDIADILPPNSTWKFCFTPALSGSQTISCVNIPVTGASENISSQITPALQPPLVGCGIVSQGYADAEAPAMPGCQYFNVTNSAFRCFTTSWGGCGSGGGGATLPTNAIVYGLGPTTSQPATSANVISLFGSCSGTQYLGADGACHTASTGSGSVLNQTNGIIPLATGPTVIGAVSPLDVGVTTPGVVTSSDPVAIQGTAGVSGAIFYGEGTSFPTPTAGQAIIFGDSANNVLRADLGTSGPYYLPSLTSLPGTYYGYSPGFATNRINSVPVSGMPQGNTVRADVGFGIGPSTGTCPACGPSIAEPINACIAFVASSSGAYGTCDARGFGGTQYLDEEIQLLSAAAYGVTLLMPDTCNWQYTVTDGVSFGVLQGDFTSLVGTGSGGGSDRCKFEPYSSATNMAALYSTDTTSSQASQGIYARVVGVAFIDSVGATWTEGTLFNWDNTNDESNTSNVFVNSTAQNASLISGANFGVKSSTSTYSGICCGQTHFNFQSYTEFGVDACRVGSSADVVKGISFVGGTCNTRGVFSSPTPLNLTAVSNSTPSAITLASVAASPGSFSLTSVATTSGGTTVYTGTITGGGSNAFAGDWFVVTGFANPLNNGSFLCTASSTTTLTLQNPNGVSVGSATATAAGAAVYTGTLTAGANDALLNQKLIVTGFTNSANNGTFTVLTSNLTTVTLANSAAVVETHAATANQSTGSATYTGTITGGANNGLLGHAFVVSGFAAANNNGTFIAIGSTATTLILQNPSAASASGSATATWTGAGNNLRLLGANLDYGNNFFGLYMESHGQTETLTPVVANDAISTGFFGPTLNSEGTSVLTAMPAFLNAGHAEDTIIIHNAQYVSGSFCVDDAAASPATFITCPTSFGNNNFLPGYNDGLIYVQNISLVGQNGFLSANTTGQITSSQTIPGTSITGNIAGLAAGLSGASLLPNGTTATTQTAGPPCDSSTDVATDAFVVACVAASTGGVSSVNTVTGALTLTDVTFTGTTGNLNSTLAHNFIFSNNGAASSPSLWLNGTIFTGGTGTTNFAQFLIQPTAATGATNWSINGTGIAENFASGFNGNAIDAKINGSSTSFFQVTSTGQATFGGSITVKGTSGVELIAAGNTNISYVSAGIVGAGTGGAGSTAGSFEANQFINVVTTVTASATPALVSTNGLQTITLNANATPTITGIAAGQRITFEICQPASGGPYTWTWPAAVHGGITTIGTMAASTCAIQSFDSFNGTTLVSENTGVTGVSP